jgi:hypothetical protein
MSSGLGVVFSDDFNVVLPSVLGSNRNGSTQLTNTFPTTSTGDSLGHYHYTESGTNALQFLNASGSGIGGHQFYNSNSTDAPVLYLTINKDEILTDTQFVVDKSVQGGTTLVNLPAIIVGQPTQIIFQYPPGLDVFGIQYGVYDNPVQVLFNAGVFTTGTTYYAQATNAQTLTIRTTPNPSDPPLDCSVFTYGQVPFAFVSGSTPSSTQIASLSDNLTITDDTNFMVLSTTDLIFDSVSLPTSVATNTTNIGTNTTNIATNTSNITALQTKQTNSLQVYSSPAIYADGRPPIAVPSSSSNTYAQFGWYFKNSTASWKINWYMPPATGMLVSDILGLYMRYFNCSTTSNDNSPFLTILTTPTGSGDYYPGFFHSSMTYIINTTPVANTSYTMFMNVSGTCPNPNSYASNIQTMIQSPVNNPRGVYAPTESVLAIVIGTNSASAVNSVEFIAQKLGVMTATGTQELLYQTIV